MKIEDPRRQLEYLQQCLSSDKKPLGFFLGAGCPVSIRVGPNHDLPLIPDISGITEKIHGELAQTQDCGPLLQKVEEHFKKDGRAETTVEDVLTHVRALRAVAGKDEIRGLSAAELDLLDERICLLIHSVADKELPGPGTPYHSVAAWVDAVRRENPVEVFTTNYDLLMEQALEDYRVPYFDGFGGSRRPFFDLRGMEEDMLPPRWARLWKLHGSVNWYQVGKGGVFRGSAEIEKGTKRVIHPSHLKYQESRRMPYLAMMDRLRAFLKQPAATLILCGFSFRDEHINEVILQGLESSQTAVAFALLFGNLSDHPEVRSLALSRSNLNLLARDGGVIGGQENEWPTKDSGAVLPTESTWVSWVPLETEGENGKRAAKLELGDFVVFGSFLEEIVGRGRERLEASDVE